MLLNLIKHQGQDINKVYLYIKDPFKSSMYQLLINGRRKVWIKKNKYLLIIHKQLMMFMKI